MLLKGVRIRSVVSVNHLVPGAELYARRSHKLFHKKTNTKQEHQQHVIIKRTQSAIIKGLVLQTTKLLVSYDVFFLAFR